MSSASWRFFFHNSFKCLVPPSQMSQIWDRLTPNLPRAFCSQDGGVCVFFFNGATRPSARPRLDFFLCVHRACPLRPSLFPTTWSPRYFSLARGEVFRSCIRRLDENLPLSSAPRRPSRSWPGRYGLPRRARFQCFFFLLAPRFLRALPLELGAFVAFYYYERIEWCSLIIYGLT